MKQSTINTILRRSAYVLLILFCSSFGFSQTETDILELYNNYAKLPREVVYVHLNKSVYIKGECIGLSAYVLDKNTKKPSAVTTNLYCTISDKNNTIIDKQLIKVTDGYAIGTFDVNENYTSGEYTIMAYTNWMKNFDEQNLFVETVRVIDPETDNIVRSEHIENELDTQFLPEGGHLVADIQNTLGVVVKNSEGFGVSEVEGIILNTNEEIITTFKTNTVGIGRFLLTPKVGQSYIAKIEHLGKRFIFNIGSPKPKGFNLMLTDLGKNVAINLKTNTATFPEIQNNTYKLAIHNGRLMKVLSFSFDKPEVLKLIKKTDLYAGMNIFTVFSSSNDPILERLYFNHENITINRIEQPHFIKDFDSLEISFSVNGLNPTRKHNMSVSVLHPDTKSYGSHQNIASYTLLQPYINGYIENGGYYFEDMDRKKKYELDNLLITQGWSSYDWHTIFNDIPKNSFAFENGIGIQANINSRKSNQFMIFALRESKGDVFVVGDNEKSFIKTGLFPSDNEKINIGEINKKGKMNKPNIYLQFSPSKVPEFIHEYSTLKPNAIPYTVATQIQSFASSILDETQELDEVLIEASKKETRMETIERRAHGTVDFFDEQMRTSNRTLAQYLSRKGFVTSDYGGLLTISVRNPLTPNNITPVVFLDGTMLADFGFLATFDMSTVDYIEINKTGIGEGVRGGAGVIKIWTDPNIQLTTQYGDNYKVYEFPLTFSRAKTFYTPKYRFYTTAFFKEYGVMGWKPKVKVDNNGKASFKIFNTNNDHIKIFIEGIDDEGNFIIDEKEIDLN